MKVSTISANTYTERFKLKALKAPKRGQENPIIENGITKKAIEIMKNLSEIIENDWAKIKKSGNLLDSPQYLVADKKGNFVTIKPVYQSQTEKYILMEVENDKTIDRVLFNRRKPYEYTFDHAVITPYGSASGKTSFLMISPGSTSSFPLRFASAIEISDSSEVSSGTTSLTS